MVVFLCFSCLNTRVVLSCSLSSAPPTPGARIPSRSVDFQWVGGRPWARDKRRAGTYNRLTFYAGQVPRKSSQGVGAKGPQTGRLFTGHTTNPGRGEACSWTTRPSTMYRGWRAVPYEQAGGCVDPRYNRRLSAPDSCRWRYTREHPTPVYRRGPPVVARRITGLSGGLCKPALHPRPR